MSCKASCQEEIPWMGPKNLLTGSEVGLEGIICCTPGRDTQQQVKKNGQFGLFTEGRG